MMDNAVERGRQQRWVSGERGLELRMTCHFELTCSQLGRKSRAAGSAHVKSIRKEHCDWQAPQESEIRELLFTQ